MIDESYGASLHAFRKAVLSAMQGVALTQLKEGIFHEQVIPRATYAPWRNDADFLTLFEKIKANTLVDIYRCHELWDLAKQLRSRTGDILEVGVWKGGTAGLLGKALGTKGDRLWLADTFAGVPKAGVNDTLYKGGEHADTSEKTVIELLYNLGVSNFTILRGLFPEETGGEIESVRFKFCHIDVDTYQSNKDVFSWVWPRMVPGGFVVFDDYGIWGCEGVTYMINELKEQDIGVIHNLNGHAVIPKS